MLIATAVKRKPTNSELSKTRKHQPQKSGHRWAISTIKSWTKGIPTLTNCSVCAHCQGRYRRDKLHVHLKYCPVYKEKQLVEGHGRTEALWEHWIPYLVVTNDVSTILRKEVLSLVHQDDSSVAALADPLIMAHVTEFHKTRRHNKYQVSNEMRLLGRSLLKWGT